MESHLSVAIVPRMVPVSAREASQAAADLGQALQDLNAAKAAGGETDVKRAEDAYRAADAAYRVETKPDGLLARVNGVEFPLTDFAVQYDPQSGAPVLSLLLAPDHLSIGEPPAVAFPPQLAYGDVPGSNSGVNISWQSSRSQPEGLGRQVAGHAERVALRAASPVAWLLGRQSGNTAVTA